MGAKSSGPAQFRTPHSIAGDAKLNVYLADRGNRGIQIFDNDGSYLKGFTNAGAPWAICITPAPRSLMHAPKLKK
jgi:hypothetical protein